MTTQNDNDTLYDEASSVIPKDEEANVKARIDNESMQAIGQSNISLIKIDIGAPSSKLLPNTEHFLVNSDNKITATKKEPKIINNEEIDKKKESDAKDTNKYEKDINNKDVLITNNGVSETLQMAVTNFINKIIINARDLSIKENEEHKRKKEIDLKLKEEAKRIIKEKEDKLNLKRDEDLKRASLIFINKMYEKVLIEIKSGKTNLQEHEPTVKVETNEPIKIVKTDLMESIQSNKQIQIETGKPVELILTEKPIEKVKVKQKLLKMEEDVEPDYKKHNKASNFVLTEQVSNNSDNNINNNNNNNNNDVAPSVENNVASDVQTKFEPDEQTNIESDSKVSISPRLKVKPIGKFNSPEKTLLKPNKGLDSEIDVELNAIEPIVKVSNKAETVNTRAEVVSTRAITGIIPTEETRFTDTRPTVPCGNIEIGDIIQNQNNYQETFQLNLDVKIPNSEKAKNIPEESMQLSLDVKLPNETNAENYTAYTIKQNNIIPEDTLQLNLDVKIPNSNNEMQNDNNANNKNRVPEETLQLSLDVKIPSDYNNTIYTNSLNNVPTLFSNPLPLKIEISKDKDLFNNGPQSRSSDENFRYTFGITDTQKNSLSSPKNNTNVFGKTPISPIHENNYFDASKLLTNQIENFEHEKYNNFDNEFAIEEEAYPIDEVIDDNIVEENVNAQQINKNEGIQLSEINFEYRHEPTPLPSKLNVNNLFMGQMSGITMKVGGERGENISNSNTNNSNIEDNIEDDNLDVQTNTKQYDVKAENSYCPQQIEVNSGVPDNYNQNNYGDLREHQPDNQYIPQPSQQPAQQHINFNNLRTDFDNYKTTAGDFNTIETRNDNLVTELSRCGSKVIYSASENINGKINLGKDYQFLQLKRLKSTLEDEYSKKLGEFEFDTKITPKSIINIEGLDKQLNSIFEEKISFSETNNILMTLNQIDITKSNIINNQINCLCNLELLNSLCGLDNFKLILSELSKDYLYARQMKSDGNAFYRCFIFAMIENYIVHNRVDKFNMLIFNFNETVLNRLDFDHHDSHTDNTICLQILYIIKSYLEKKDLTSAYHIFIKALIHYQDLFPSLVKFMRMTIINYAKVNCHNAQLIKAFSVLIPEYYRSIGETIYNNTNGDYDLNSYLKESLLPMNIEADNFVIYISPIIFNFNINLHIFEGSGYRNNKNMVNYCVKKLYSLNRENHHTIEMLYKFQGFTLLYPKTELQKNDSEINQIYKSTFIQIQNIKRISTMSKVACEICKKNEDSIKLDHIRGTQFCKTCCKTKINKLVNQRVRSFIENDFINKEYYCRPIVIDTQHNYVVYDEDLLEVAKNTIPQVFLFILEKICFYCRGIVNKNSHISLTKLECGCQCCKDCLEKYLLQENNGLLYKNSYEISKYFTKILEKSVKSESVNQTCLCQGVFNKEKAINFLYPDPTILQKKAQERLSTIASSTCMNCDNNKQNLSLKFSVIRIHPSKEVLNEINNGVHIMCKNCIYSKANSIKKKPEKAVNGLYPLQCKICNTTHEVQKSIYDSTFKTEAACKCLIF